MTPHYQNKLKTVLEYIESTPVIVLPQQLQRDKDGIVIALKEALNTCKQVHKNGGLKTVLVTSQAGQNIDLFMATDFQKPIM